MAHKLELPAIKIAQETPEGRDIYITTIKIGYLLNPAYFEVRWWKREKIGTAEQGYQRVPTEGRKAKIARFIEKNDHPIFPTNILVCSEKKIEFDSRKKAITINHYPLSIVDGQTRIEGFRYASEDLKLDHILNHEVPVVVLSGFPLIDELEQFYILNSTQKKVPTDLAQRLKLELARDDSNKFDILYPGQKWEIVCMNIVDILNKNSNNPWTSRIKLPNTQKSLITIINQNSFIQSLKPLFREGGIFEGEKPDGAAKVLTSYWNALRRIFPYAFQIPREYVIQKTPGVFSLHSLANVVVSRAIKDKLDITEFNLMRLLNHCFQEEQKKDDFWRRDGEGAALYGSMKGFALLTSDFKNNFSNNY